VTSTTLSSGNVRRWLTQVLLLAALALVGLLSLARPASAAGQVFSDPSVHVKNAGTAVATSGQNNTVGNSSRNVAVNDQRSGGRGLGFNSTSTGNASNGSSSTTTGSADAVGNDTTSSISQSVNADGFDGVALIRQNFDGANIGTARAISGMNTAAGNRSVNLAISRQGTFSSGSTAVNSAATTNGSDGLAVILTGDATATGNTASTTASQIANATPGSAHGLALINQTAAALNRGSAAAVTGGNTAFGNASFNLANAVQGATSARGPPAPVATNMGNATNSSNGTAQIDTGAATATGSNSDTELSQEDDAPDKLPNITESSSTVINRGSANATTGANRAAGNSSSNTATNSQGASGGGPAVNTALADNYSNGNASITTGNADAAGNKATAIDADVLNRGSANAITGGNRAAGNASGNTADNLQRATGGRVAFNTATVRNNSDGTATITTGNATALGNDAWSDGGGTIVNRGVAAAITGNNDARGNVSGNSAFNTQFVGGGLATNLATAINKSTGTATVTTGAADALGNWATTNVDQDSSGSDDPWVQIDQTVLVNNRGSALAVTGQNNATGNGSTNIADTLQRAFGGRVAANLGDTSTHSDGFASIHTGSANATGNKSSTAINQNASVPSEHAPLSLVDQTLVVRNAGDATAVSGRNIGTGNGSASLGINRQFVGAVAAVHTNTASSQGNSDGTADIDTGNSAAVGNLADNAGDQNLMSGAAA
jgi:hypothetical protein